MISTNCTTEWTVRSDRFLPFISYTPRDCLTLNLSHTTAERVNLLHQLLKGQEQFELAWTTEGVESDDVILDPLLTRSSTVLVRDMDITRTLLERRSWTSKDLINGRLLRTRADDSVKNIKKALSFFPNYLEDNGNYKSGMNKKKMASGRCKFSFNATVLSTNSYPT